MITTVPDHVSERVLDQFQHLPVEFGLRAQHDQFDFLVEVAREVAHGRVDLHSAEHAEHEHGWRRLRAIPGIGPWTVEKLAPYGQGRHDQVPAGDLAYLKLVGRLLSGGDPRARADEQQVREFFAPYGKWAGMAATHLLGSTHG